MKNIQPFIIAGMTIIIVVLFLFLYSSNTDVKIYKEQLELSKLKNSKESVKKQTESVILEIQDKSTKSVEKSNLLIKKITHEKIKISDTTGVYMLDFIRNYRPE